MHDIDAGHGLEHLGDQMPRRAVAARGVIQFRRPRLRQRDQFADGLYRQRWMRGQHKRNRCDQRHRREVAHHVIRELEEIRTNGVRAGGQQQRIAIGRRTRHHLGRQHAAAAPALLDHHLLAPGLAKALAEYACHGVRSAARQPADRFHGILLSDDRLRAEYQYHQWRQQILPKHVHLPPRNAALPAAPLQKTQSRRLTRLRERLHSKYPHDRSQVNYEPLIFHKPAIALLGYRRRR